MQPLFGNRGRQDRPVCFAVDPCAQIVFQFGLAQIKMLGLAHFQIGGPEIAERRIDQVGRVQLLGAVVALIAARSVVAAIGAGALDIAIGQKPPSVLE